VNLGHKGSGSAVGDSGLERSWSRGFGLAVHDGKLGLKSGKTENLVDKSANTK
jgi:hypothetical protein